MHRVTRQSECCLHRVTLGSGLKGDADMNDRCMLACRRQEEEEDEFAAALEEEQAEKATATVKRTAAGKKRGGKPSIIF